MVEMAETDARLLTFSKRRPGCVAAGFPVLLFTQEHSCDRAYDSALIGQGRSQIVLGAA